MEVLRDLPPENRSFTLFGFLLALGGLQLEALSNPWHPDHSAHLLTVPPAVSREGGWGNTPFQFVTGQHLPQEQQAAAPAEEHVD